MALDAATLSKGFSRGDPAVPPGVHRTEDDTDLLIGVMRRGSYAVDRQVLDIGTGSGALAIAAARAGATSVSALRAGSGKPPIRSVGEQCAARDTPSLAPGTPGRTGALLDRICAGAGDILTPNADLLLVRSELDGAQRTLDALTEAGLRAQVLARASGPFGPVLRAWAAMLVSGPAEIVLPDGRRVKSDRPVTVLSVCKHSRRQPFCDSSHRCRAYAAATTSRRRTVLSRKPARPVGQPTLPQPRGPLSAAELDALRRGPFVLSVPEDAVPSGCRRIKCDREVC